MPIDNDWYDDLGDGWWDPRGPVAALHEFNHARAAYAVELIRCALPDVARPRVLDIGAGGGLFSASLSAVGFEVIGLDASVPSLRAARRNTVQPGDPLAPSYLTGDALRLPLADASVDAAVCSEVLEHVEAPGVLIEEAARVLRPGGLFYFDTPNRTLFARIGLIEVAERIGWAPRGTHDYRRFLTPGELSRLVRAAGLRRGPLRGFSLRRNPLLAAWGYARRRYLGGFALGDELRFVIAGSARKPPIEDPS